MTFLFEKLDVYQKSISLADELFSFTSSLPKGMYFLKEQLNRASLSIANNIAEGNGRWHKADRKQFFLMARASAFECIPMLELCKRKNLISDSLYLNFKSKIVSICKMLSGLSNIK